MDGRNHTFFSHRQCEFFPCHPGADTTHFNCLFCFCPLYSLGDGCGGRVSYTKEVLKDCSLCDRPHRPGGYDWVLERLKETNDSSKEEKDGRE